MKHPVSPDRKIHNHLFNNKKHNMDKQRLRRFLSRNVVAIVMVPTIIALHFGWSAIQKNRTLVKESEEIDLPVVTFYKYCLRKLSEKEPTKVTAVKAENP